MSGAPLGHRLLVLLQMPAVVLAGQQRDQGLQALFRIPDHRDLDRHPHPGPGRVGVDLHDPDFAGLGQVLGVGEVGADHEQRVAVLHQILTGPGTEQPDPADRVLGVVRDDRLAGQGLDDRRAEPVSHGKHLVPGVQRTRTGQDGHVLPLVQHPGGGLQVRQPGLPGRGR